MSMTLRLAPTSAHSASRSLAVGSLPLFLDTQTFFKEETHDQTTKPLQVDPLES